MNLEHKTRPDDPRKLNYIQTSSIIVGDSKIHGRGVFATENIGKNELIERCPLILMEYRSKYQLDPQIFNYMYAQPPCSCKDCQTHGFLLHMALGYGMLYNHQDKPNAMWKFNYSQLLADVICVEDINKGEEIFVSYGNQYFNDKTKINLIK
jgi:SET domain-containing protein